MSSCAVVYFSITGETYFPSGIKHVKVGNTAKVALKLAEILGCEAKEIVPVEKYPKGYDAQLDRAKAELKGNARPAIEPMTVDADDIYLLYPNWYGTAPMPVMTFLESQDWNERRINPLCTNEGSGLGHSVSDIRKIAEGAEVTDGLEIRGNKADECEADLKKWVHSLAF